jgi:hypothetical protein
MSVSGMSAFALLLGDKRTSSDPVPVVPGTPSTASVAACLPIVAGRSCRHGHQIARDDLRQLDPGGGRAGDRSPQASRLACVRGVEHAHARLSGSGAANRPRSATRSMPLTAISKFVASVATPIRPLRSTSCGDRRRRRSMSWNATCGARTAWKFAAIRTSAAIWWRCARPKSRRAIRHRHGGRASGDDSA